MSDAMFLQLTESQAYSTSRQLNALDDSPSCRSFDPSRPLMWYRHGRWKRTVVTIDEVVHNFPAPRTEFLT